MQGMLFLYVVTEENNLSCRMTFYFYWHIFHLWVNIFCFIRFNLGGIWTKSFLIAGRGTQAHTVHVLWMWRAEHLFTNDTDWEKEIQLHTDIHRLRRYVNKTAHQWESLCRNVSWHWTLLSYSWPFQLCSSHVSAIWTQYFALSFQTLNINLTLARACN